MRVRGRVGERERKAMSTKEGNQKTENPDILLLWYDYSHGGGGGGGGIGIGGGILSSGG